MDISKILTKYYLENSWCCGETYDTLKWNDTAMSKPTKDELEHLWNDLLKEEMRARRDELLKESDAHALGDYPHKTEERRQEWLDYRQQLRNLPSVWSVGASFPVKPIS